MSGTRYKTSWKSFLKTERERELFQAVFVCVFMLCFLRVTIILYDYWLNRSKFSSLSIADLYFLLKFSLLCVGVRASKTKLVWQPDSVYFWLIIESIYCTGQCLQGKNCTEHGGSHLHEADVGHGQAQGLDARQTLFVVEGGETLAELVEGGVQVEHPSAFPDVGRLALSQRLHSAPLGLPAGRGQRGSGGRGSGGGRRRSGHPRQEPLRCQGAGVRGVLQEPRGPVPEGRGGGVDVGVGNGAGEGVVELHRGQVRALGQTVERPVTRVWGRRCRPVLPVKLGVVMSRVTGGVKVVGVRGHGCCDLTISRHVHDGGGGGGGC